MSQWKYIVQNSQDYHNDNSVRNDGGIRRWRIWGNEHFRVMGTTTVNTNLGSTQGKVRAMWEKNWSIQSLSKRWCPMCRRGKWCKSKPDVPVGKGYKVGKRWTYQADMGICNL